MIKYTIKSNESLFNRFEELGTRITRMNYLFQNEGEITEEELNEWEENWDKLSVKMRNLKDEVKRLATTQSEEMIQQGKVTWFNPEKGYGFIEDIETKDDVFCMWSAIEVEGFKVLVEGELVEYKATNERRGKQATWVKPLDRQ